MSKLLLDTNAYAALFRGDKAVIDALAEAERIYMSVIVIGELYAGFKGGSKERKNRNDLGNFLKKPTVRTLDVKQDTAELFADIKGNLTKLGKPIPINDVWIAAHTQETGSVLVTFDKHFGYVPGLRVWQG